MVDVSDSSPPHKLYHCATHAFDTDEKSTWLSHITTKLHYEYGRINCAICGKPYNVPKSDPIPAVLFQKGMAAHPECQKAATT